MTEWDVKRLDEVADRVAVKNTAGYQRVLTVAAGSGLVDQEAYFNKRIASADLGSYWVVEPGDFVYNKSTSKEAPWGVVGRWDGDEPAVVTTLYIVFRPRPNVTSDFLLHACNSRFFFNSLRGMLREGARAHGLLNVRLGEFFGARLVVPSVVEQRRMMSVIKATDQHVAAIEEELIELRGMTAATVKDLLAPGEDWEEVSISDVSTPATGRAFPERYQGVGDGVLPYFKVADMNLRGNERELRVAPNWLTDVTIGEVKPRICPAGTVVFPIIGAALLTEKRRLLVRPSAFDQNVMGLIVDDGISSDFLFAVMSNVRLVRLSRTSAVPSVNQKVVGAIRFAVPPTMDEQRAIGLQVKALHRQQEDLAAELVGLRAFRSSLLDSFLTQEIEIPESYDSLLEEAT